MRQIKYLLLLLFNIPFTIFVFIVITIRVIRKLMEQYRSGMPYFEYEELRKEVESNIESRRYLAPHINSATWILLYVIIFL